MAGTLVANTINTDTGLFSTNNAYLGIAKAWCNYTPSTGTINGSFNVSSITKNSTGYYTVNLTTAMPNINYSLVGAACNTSGQQTVTFCPFTQTSSPYTLAPTTSTFTFTTQAAGVGFFDVVYAQFAVLGA